MKDLEECVCVWNFASNLGKLLLKCGKCFNKPSETNVRAERSVLSGTVISKQEEHWLMKIPKWTTFHVNRQCSHRCSSWFDSLKSLFDYQIAEDVGISFRSCQAILTEKLKMHHAAPKFVPHVLIEDQKANHVNVSQELLDRVSVDENFLKTIVTGDKTWFLAMTSKPRLSRHNGWGKDRPNRRKLEWVDPAWWWCWWVSLTGMV